MARKRALTPPTSSAFLKNLAEILPDGWGIVPLSLVAAVRYGKPTPKQAGNVPVVGSGGVFASTAEPLVNHSTVVVGRKGTAGLAWLQETPCWPSDTTFYLDWLTDAFEPYFIYQWLRLNPLSGTHAKTTLPSLHRNDLEQHPIPIISLTEQRAICDVLRTLDLAKEAAKKTITAARQLKASVMRHLFTYGPVAIGEADRVALKQTEVGPIPETWDVVSLGSVVEFLQYGTSSRCHSEAVGVPVLRIPNVIGDEIDTRDLKYIEMGPTERKKYSLKEGDLLFVRTNGRREYIGRCAVFQDQPAEALFASYLIRARLRREQVLPEFMQMYSTMPAGRANLSGRASGAADGKYNINTQILKSVMLPRPSIEEQAEIIRAVKAVSQRETVAKKSADALGQLFQSVLRELMTGRLRLADMSLTSSLEVAP